MTDLEREAVKQAIRHLADDEGEGGPWSFETGMDLLRTLASVSRGRTKKLRELLAEHNRK